MNQKNNYQLYLAGIISEEQYLESSDPIMANLVMPNSMPKKDEMIPSEPNNEQKLLQYLDDYKKDIKKYVPINPNQMQPKVFYGLPYNGEDINFMPPRWGGKKMLIRKGYMIGGSDIHNLAADFYGIHPEEFKKNYKIEEKLI